MILFSYFIWYNQDPATNNHLIISRVRPNKEVVFEVSCTERFKHFSYTFVARGRIIDAGHVNVMNKKKYSFRYKLLAEMAPQAKLIVSHISRDYLIYDVLDLDFDVFNNDVSR